MARISVIVPVYNAERYIEKCISSIANQTMQDIEILAINDGSTDDSLTLLDNLSQRYTGKLKIFNKENGGAGAARNIGLDNATGEFIKFVDADDYLELNILEKMYQVARDFHVSLVRGNYSTIIGKFHTIDRCSWSDIRRNQVVDVRENKDYIVTETPGIGNKLIHRDLLGDLKFPENTKWEDLAIMPVVIASSEKLFHLDEPVYNYRVNMNTTIRDFIYKIPNILDIIKCLDCIENKMEERGLTEQYKRQIESLYILHTLYRIENAMLWINFPRKKKKIVVSSLLGILDAKYPMWKSNETLDKYRKNNFLFNFDMSRLDKFIDLDYRSQNLEEADSNIRKTFR